MLTNEDMMIDSSSGQTDRFCCKVKKKVTFFLIFLLFLQKKRYNDEWCQKTLLYMERQGTTSASLSGCVYSLTFATLADAHFIKQEPNLKWIYSDPLL